MILGMAYYAMRKVWTSNVDVVALLRVPSEQIPVAKDAVSITPGTLEFSGSNWSTSQVVEVRNNDHRTVYSVWIKVWSDSGDFDPKEIQIAMPGGSTVFSENVGDVSTDFGLLRLQGLDANKRPCIYLDIFRVVDRAPFIMKFTRETGAAKPEKRMSLVLDVKGFSYEAAQTVSKPGEAGLMIKPPESFTLKSISVMLSKRPQG